MSDRTRNFVKGRAKSRFFGTTAILVMIVGAAPGAALAQWLHPPRLRAGEEPIVGHTTALYAGACVLAALIVLVIAHRAPADRPFLGETRKSWLILLYACLAMGFALGVAVGLF